MLDSHCHVDLLSDPVECARKFNRTLSVCVAVTYLPEHFELAKRHLAGFPNVVPSLGMHPLHAIRAHAQLSRFHSLVKSARFIGEIGLDASAEGKATLALQKKILAEVAAAVQPGSFVTVHSRNAWQETFQTLSEHGLGPVCFHYFTAGAAAAETLAAKGHYFSINRRMVDLTSRHIEVVSGIPRNRVLVESDAPFLGEHAILQDLETVYHRLAELWQMGLNEVIRQVAQNFAQCRTERRIAQLG